MRTDRDGSTPDLKQGGEICAENWVRMSSLEIARWRPEYRDHVRDMLVARVRVGKPLQDSSMSSRPRACTHKFAMSAVPLKAGVGTHMP